MISLLHCLFGVFSLVASAHPIHVSVTEIEYDPKDEALEIMMRIFTDDLELTLRTAFDKPTFDVMRSDSKDALDEMMDKYLQLHFRITLDGATKTLNYLGHELDGDAFVFFVEVANVKPWKTIEVMNDVIMETYDDQSNIVHVYLGENVKSARLTPRRPATRLTF